MKKIWALLLAVLFVYASAVPHSLAQTRSFIAFMGAYSPTTNYTRNDIVVYGGYTYISLNVNNLNNEPDTHSSNWLVFSLVAFNAGGLADSIQYNNAGVLGGSLLSGIVVGSTSAAPRVATSADVIALFASGSCIGFMRGDATCPTVITTSQGGTGTSSLTGIRRANGASADTAATGSYLASILGTTSLTLSYIAPGQAQTGTYDFSTATNLILAPNSTTSSTPAPGDSSSAVPNTNWVMQQILGQNFKVAVAWATHGALPAVTYNNGTAGAGATLTENSNGVLSVDSGTPTGGDRVLVKDQSDNTQNGIYTVTVVGGSSTQFVLTRATDFDGSLDIKPGDSTYVTGGVTYTNTTWAYAGVANPTIGTSAISFSQTAGPGSYLPGNGLTLTGLTFAIDTSITVDLHTSQSLTNKIVNGVTLSTSATAGTFLGWNGSYSQIQYSQIGGTVPTWNQNTTGNAATATAFASSTLQCTTNQYSTGVTISGNANCSQVSYAQLTGSIPTWNQSTTGNAATASASDHSLTQCASGYFSTGDTTAWAANCSQVTYANLTGSVPTWNQNTTGNAATATALASAPAQCTSGLYSTGITTLGVANCSQVSYGQLSGAEPVNAITALTGDGTASGIGAVAFTLANVLSPYGNCGDATHVCAITTNSKGLVTAISATAITASTVNALTFNISGGASPGASFNGSTAITVSPGTIGAPALATNNVFTGINTFGNIILSAIGTATSSNNYQSSYLTMNYSYWNSGSANLGQCNMYTNVGDLVYLRAVTYIGCGFGSLPTALSVGAMQIGNSSAGAYTLAVGNGSSTPWMYVDTSGNTYVHALSINGASLGTAAFDNTGTSGANIPLLNGTNTWSGVNTFSSNIFWGNVTSACGTGISGGALKAAGSIIVCSGGSFVFSAGSSGINFTNNNASVDSSGDAQFANINITGLSGAGALCPNGSSNYFTQSGCTIGYANVTGLGTMATQNANAVAITAGSIIGLSTFSAVSVLGTSYGTFGQASAAISPLWVHVAANEDLRFDSQSGVTTISGVNDAANAFVPTKIDASLLMLNGQSTGNVLINATTDIWGYNLAVNGSMFVNGHTEINGNANIAGITSYYTVTPQANAAGLEGIFGNAYLDSFGGSTSSLGNLTIRLMSSDGSLLTNVLAFTPTSALFSENTKIALNTSGGPTLSLQDSTSYGLKTTIGTIEFDSQTSGSTYESRAQITAGDVNYTGGGEEGAIYLAIKSNNVMTNIFASTTNISTGVVTTALNPSGGDVLIGSSSDNGYGLQVYNGFGQSLTGSNANSVQYIISNTINGGSIVMSSVGATAYGIPLWANANVIESGGNGVGGTMGLVIDSIQNNGSCCSSAPIIFQQNRSGTPSGEFFSTAHFALGSGTDCGYELCVTGSALISTSLYVGGSGSGNLVCTQNGNNCPTSLTLGGAVTNSNITAGTGAGTSPSIAVSGYDGTFLVVLTPGVSPVSTGIIFTLTFTSSRGHSSSCTFSPANGFASALSGASAVSVGASSSTSMQMYSGLTPLVAATTYQWTVNCP